MFKISVPKNKYYENTYWEESDQFLPLDTEKDEDFRFKVLSGPVVTKKYKL